MKIQLWAVPTNITTHLWLSWGLSGIMQGRGERWGVFWWRLVTERKHPFLIEVERLRLSHRRGCHVMEILLGMEVIMLKILIACRCPAAAGSWSPQLTSWRLQWAWSSASSGTHQWPRSYHAMQVFANNFTLFHLGWNEMHPRIWDSCHFV